MTAAQFLSLFLAIYISFVYIYATTGKNQKDNPQSDGGYASF